MARSYHKMDEVELAFEGNKKRLRTEGSIILQRVMNEALAEMTSQFQESLAHGELLQLGGTAAEMKQYLKLASEKQFALPAK